MRCGKPCKIRAIIVLINRKGDADMEKVWYFKGNPSDIVALKSRLGREVRKSIICQ